VDQRGRGMVDGIARKQKAYHSKQTKRGIRKAKQHARLVSKARNAAVGMPKAKLVQKMFRVTACDEGECGVVSKKSTTD